MSSDPWKRTHIEILNSLGVKARAASKTVQNLPQNALVARRRVHRGVISACKKLPVSLSDDYIIGAVDIFASLAVLYVTTPAIVRSFRCFPTAAHIPSNLVNNRSTLHGAVVAVRDGDNLRIRHAPFLHRIFNWYTPPKGTNISQTTINVRLAGIDAPECASFGNKGQKYGPIARDWLKDYALGRKVSFRIHAIDQYKRAVATVYRKPENAVLRSLGLGRKNIGLELTRSGYATIYTGAGAQYGSARLMRLYQKVEQRAKNKRVGMWSENNVITPKQYKQALKVGGNRLRKLMKKEAKSAKGAKASHNGVEASPQSSDSDSFAAVRLFEDMYNFLKRFR
ncbi:endonuclease lcl3 [Gracilaria domingensis]|nr:endonuclease lcl3 [Gracilaria domingensis]